MQDERLPPSLEKRIVLSFVSGIVVYSAIGASLVERCIGETTLGVRTWENTHYAIAVLSGFIFAFATECLCVFYGKQSNNTADDLTAGKVRTIVKHDTEHKGSEFGGLIIVVVFLAFLILFGTAQLFILFPWLWPM